jgi:hypothetical protein
MCLAQMKHTPPTSINEDKPTTPKAKKTDHRYQPYSTGGAGKGGPKSEKKEEGLLDTSCVMELACPSAWHALSDR